MSTGQRTLRRYRRRTTTEVSATAPERATGPTIIGTLAGIAAIIALVEVVALGVIPRVPLWPAVSGILTAIAMWLTLVLIRKGPSSTHPRHISPLVLFAGVYFISGSLGPALWLLSPLDPPGFTGSSGSALIYVLGTFASFVVTALAASLHSRRASPPAEASHQAATTLPSASGIPGAAVLIVLGLVGLYLRFPTVSSLASYFSADYDELSRRAEGAVGYLGSVLRPLLPAGLFVWWLNGRSTLRGVLLFVATLVTMGSFSLNRGYVIVPLAAFAVAYHARVRRIPAGVVVAGLGAIAVAFVVTGALRTTTLNSQGGLYDVTNPLDAGLAQSTAQTLQLYAQPPLQTSIVLEAGPHATDGAATALSSVAGPLPGVPDGLREGTGTREYNRLIYGQSVPADQILPSHLEAWWLAGIAGLLGWSFLLGRVFRRLDGAMVEARTLPTLLVLSVAALWLAQFQIVSITVLVQSTLYMGPAALVLLVLTRKLQIR